MIRAFIILCLLALHAPQSFALVDKPLADPALEARARALFLELRCPVCQNQSIDDSDAELAQDLRSFVRARISAGDSDAAVRNHLAARYGDYILFRPALAPQTYFLWGAPLLLLMLGLYIGFRRR